MIKTIIGPNSYTARQTLIKEISKYKELNGEDSIVRIEGDVVEVPQLQQQLSSQSLFSPNILVVVSGIAEEKTLHDDLMDMYDELPDTAQLVLFDPVIDKRSRYYKYLKNNTNLVDHQQLDEQRLVHWIQQYLESLGGEIDRSSAQYLLDRLGDDQWMLATEIDKLANVKQPVNRETIDDLVEITPRESIFQLLDATMAGQTKKALELYDSMQKQRMEPQYILSMIIWQLHNVALVISGGKKSADQIASETGLSPFVARKTKDSSSNYNRAQLNAMLEDTVKTDIAIKTTSIDATQAVRQLLIKLSSN